MVLLLGARAAAASAAPSATSAQSPSERSNLAARMEKADGKHRGANLEQTLNQRPEARERKSPIVVPSTGGTVSDGEVTTWYPGKLKMGNPADLHYTRSRSGADRCPWTLELLLLIGGAKWSDSTKQRPPRKANRTLGLCMSGCSLPPRAARLIGSAAIVAFRGVCFWFHFVLLLPRKAEFARRPSLVAFLGLCTS